MDRTLLQAIPDTAAEKSESQQILTRAEMFDLIFLLLAIRLLAELEIDFEELVAQIESLPLAKPEVE